MADLIRQLNESGSMVRVALGIEKRTQMRPSGKRNFVTPTLTMLDTPFEIMSGKASISSLAPAQPAPKAIAAPVDDVVDAEIIEEDPAETVLRLEVFHCANYFDVPALELWHGIVKQVKGKEGSLTDDQKGRIAAAITKMKDGEIAPAGFNTDHTPIWKRN